jgi:hypothetical protein
MISSSRRAEVAALGELRFRSPLRRSATPGDSCPKFVPEQCFIRPVAEIVLGAGVPTAQMVDREVFRATGDTRIHTMRG